MRSRNINSQFHDIIFWKTKLVRVVLLLSMMGSPIIATAGIVEISLLKFSDDAGGFLYDIEINTIKAGAATCELTTLTGATACTKVGEEFSVNRTNLAWATMSLETTSSWTVVFDKSLPTETVAIIDLGFGTVDPDLEESTWLPVPTLTAPLDGALGVSPNTSFEWNYGPLSATGAQLDSVDVLLQGLNNVEIESDELPLDSLSWTPLSPLASGDWTVKLENATTDIRLVPDGLTITKGTWDITNSDWLSLDSIDRASFTVATSVPEPATIALVSLGLAGIRFRRKKQLN